MGTPSFGALESIPWLKYTLLVLGHNVCTYLGMHREECLATPMDGLGYGSHPCHGASSQRSA